MSGFSLCLLRNVRVSVDMGAVEICIALNLSIMTFSSFDQMFASAQTETIFSLDYNSKFRDIRDGTCTRYTLMAHNLNINFSISGKNWLSDVCSWSPKWTGSC